MTLALARWGLSKSTAFLLGTSTGILVLLLLAVFLISLFLGLQDRVSLRIGLRNFVRGRRRTGVLLLGLLIGTAIISSSLVVGDTVSSLSTHFAYIMDGKVNEAVYASTPTGGYAPLPYAFYLNLSASARNLSDVRGVSPLLLALGAASGLDQDSGVPQTGMNLIGTDANVSAPLGPFTSPGGAQVPGPVHDGILLDPTAATDLDAKAGDHLVLYGARGGDLNVTVLSLVKADGRGGFQDGGSGNVFTSLADADYLMGTPGAVNYLAVTNVPGPDTGMGVTPKVLPELRAALPAVIAQFPPGSLPGNLGVSNILAADVAHASDQASQLTTLFLVIGLFSIVSGAILVVGIFVLLSEERRGQMGVARAIGMTRRQLVKSYYFEGLAYSAGSALLGTLVGVGIAYLLMEILAGVLAPGNSTTAIVQSFTVLPSSMLTAYVAGFFLTLSTVTFTVAYIGRLNIVRAIRSLPEPPLTHRSFLRIAIVGLATALLGSSLIWEGLPASADIDVALLGTSLLILGLGLVATYFVRTRYAMTAVGAALIVFWGYYPLRKFLYGTAHGGGIAVFFQEGVSLILGAILLYLFNADLVMRAVSRLMSRNPRHVPVVRVAFSYPAHKRLRTAMTLAIFSMVLFTIVAVASIGSGVSTNVADAVAAQSGGYTMAGFSDRPISDLPGLIAKNSTLAPLFHTLVPFDSTLGSVEATTGRGSTGFTAQIAANPLGLPANQDFYTTNQYNFTATENGTSSASVWKTLEEDPGAAVVSGDFAASRSSGIDFGPSGPLSLGDALNLSVPRGNATLHVHVIGILSESVLSVILINPGAMNSTLRTNTTSLFLLTTGPGVDPQKAIYDLKRAFFPYGLQLLDFEQVFESGLQFTIAFIDLLEVFVTLGLVVGIAAIGILALRAVVERRSEVGMLRAIGFRRRQVLTTFLTEYSFLSLLGIAIGTSLGILLSYTIAQSESSVISFSVPWANIALVVGLSYGLTLLATGGPSYRASRIPPAEALRYSE